MGLILQTAVLYAVILSCKGFRSPFDKSLSLPYGRLMRAEMAGRVYNPEEAEQSDDLQWWHGISRNNTINCKCGTFKVSDHASRWENEGKKTVNVYPWSVSLVAPGSMYSYCGGSLVNDRYVLTQAACVDGSSADGVEVLIGTWPNAHFPNMTNPDEEIVQNRVFRKKVHRVIIHPKYIDKHLDYNIALLRLQGPVPTYGNENELSPVCLPDQEYNYDGMNASSLLWRFRDMNGIVVPEKRSEVYSRLLSKKECKAFEYSKEWMNMPDTMMCSKIPLPQDKEHPYYTSYDCPGDAGGPLLVQKGEQMIQVGIDSWTACYGRPKGVGVYTRVAAFLPWIKLHISEDGRLCSK